MQINVSQLLKASIGSTRDYEVSETVDLAGGNNRHLHADCRSGVGCGDVGDASCNGVFTRPPTANHDGALRIDWRGLQSGGVICQLSSQCGFRSSNSIDYDHYLSAGVLLRSPTRANLGPFPPPGGLIPCGS